MDRFRILNIWNQIRMDKNPSKPDRIWIRSDNIHTIYIPSGGILCWPIMSVWCEDDGGMVEESLWLIGLQRTTAVNSVWQWLVGVGHHRERRRSWGGLLVSFFLGSGGAAWWFCMKSSLSFATVLTSQSNRLFFLVKCERSCVVMLAVVVSLLVVAV